MKQKVFPRLKFISVAVLSSLMATLRSPALFIIIFGILMTLMLFIKTKKINLKRIKPLFNIGVFIILFWLLFNRTETIGMRVLSGFTAAIKIMDISLLVFLYTSVTSASEIITVFSFLPRQLQLVLMTTLGLIPVIFAEYEKIELVQKSRGMMTSRFNFAANILPVVIPLIHRTLKRAEQLSLVISARGYDEQ